MYGRYGIKLSALTQGLLDEIVVIHDRVTGAHGSRYGCLLKDVLEQLKRSNGAQFCFGSRLDRNSKLEIFSRKYLSDGDKVIMFFFYPNYLTTEEEMRGEPGELRRTFAAEVDKLLVERGVAVQMPSL